MPRMKLYGVRRMDRRHGAGGISSQPTISCVMLNYHTPEMTAQTVGLFLDACSQLGLRSQAIVVDNESSPSEYRVLLSKLNDRCTVVPSRENLGFARACNVGMRISSGTYILLLNSDAYATPESLRNGLDYLMLHPDAGLWAPRLINSDGSIQASCGRLPSLAWLLREYLLPGRAGLYVGFENWSEPTRVEVVTGAFMLFPRSLVLSKVGMLDERFFFNMEDVDFCQRLHHAGLDVIYDPRCSIVHDAGRSQVGVVRRYQGNPQLHRARIEYFRKYWRPRDVLLAKAIMAAGLGLRKAANSLELCLQKLQVRLRT